MKKIHSPKFILSLLLIGLVGFLLYQTVTAKVILMYLFMAPHAPITLKYECFRQNQTKVAQKFTQPLDFDAQSKNALREYWYFSYLKQCLHDHRLDISGQALPESTLINGVYANPEAKYRINAGVADVVLDNHLNVDLDSRRLESILIIDNHQVILGAYQSYDPVVAPLLPEFETCTLFSPQNLPLTLQSPDMTEELCQTLKPYITFL